MDKGIIGTAYGRLRVNIYTEPLQNAESQVDLYCAEASTVTSTTEKIAAMIRNIVVKFNLFRSSYSIVLFRCLLYIYSLRWHVQLVEWWPRSLLTIVRIELFLGIFEKRVPQKYDTCWCNLR